MKPQIPIIILLILIMLPLLASATWGYPVACTARGCLTNQTVNRQVQIDRKFAEATKQSAPTREESFTTSVRRHLVKNAAVQEPATLADARRYREEILHLKEESVVKEVSGLTLGEYDEFVILPFLQQAALQQQRKAESVEELHDILRREHFVLIMP